MKITEVAVAIFLKPDGTFLLSSRPEGKPYPGYWEFPGGKIEAGETVRDALVRELIEELNVTITKTTPWFTFVMHYTHATVRLHCWRVWAWHGEMRGMEGQQFQWQSLVNMTVAPTLPGCVPIFNALRLPAVYAITNASEMGAAAYLQHLRAVLSKSATSGTPVAGFADAAVPGMIQIREKAMPAAQLKTFAKSVVALAREFGAKALVNSNVALAKEVGADGVHLTSAQLATLNERPDFSLVGASTHTRAELERAAALKCDFAVLGPVKVTQTHPGLAAMGWDRFASTVEAVPLPCYALGGLALSDLTQAIADGAHGVAFQRLLTP